MPSSYAGEQFSDGKTVDEVIEDARMGHAEPDVDEDQVLTELDMVLEKDQYIESYQGTVSSISSLSSGSDDHWPPYENALDLISFWSYFR